MWFSLKEWEKPFNTLHWIRNNLKKPCVFFGNPERAKSSSFLRYDSIFSCWFFWKNGFFFEKNSKNIFWIFFKKKIHFFKKINKKKSNPRYFCGSRFQWFTISSMASSVCLKGDIWYVCMLTCQMKLWTHFDHFTRFPLLKRGYEIVSPFFSKRAYASKKGLILR